MASLRAKDQPESFVGYGFFIGVVHSVNVTLVRHVENTCLVLRIHSDTLYLLAAESCDVATAHIFRVLYVSERKDGIVSR